MSKNLLFNKYISCVCNHYHWFKLMKSYYFVLILEKKKVIYQLLAYLFVTFHGPMYARQYLKASLHVVPFLPKMMLSGILVNTVQTSIPCQQR